MCALPQSSAANPLQTSLLKKQTHTSCVQMEAAAVPLIAQLRGIKQFVGMAPLFKDTVDQINDLIYRQEEQLASLRQAREQQSLEHDAQCFSRFCAMAIQEDKIAVVASDGTKLIACKDTLKQSPGMTAMLSSGTREQHTNEIVFSDVSVVALKLVLFSMHHPDVCLRRAGAIDVSSKQAIIVLLDACRFTACSQHCGQGHDRHLPPE